MRQFRHTFKALGGLIELQLYATSEQDAVDSFRTIEEEVTRIERKYSRYLPDSVVSTINASAGKHSVTVDQETAGLLNYADACYQQSDKLFDISSGILRRVWDFKSRCLPDSESVEGVLELIGWHTVGWNAPEIYLPKPGMEIDFGGIGKEYAADRCAAVLRELGVSFGFVNLSGDLHIIGPHVDGSPWQIGIQHPRETEQVIGSIELSGGALATSGDYERYMEIEGVRYCHILNPKTGWPVDELQSVTVHGESCLVAGSLATISMLLGKGRARKLLREANVKHLIVDELGVMSGTLIE